MRAVAIGLTLVLGACQVHPAGPEDGERLPSRVSKFCDEGRAVYVANMSSVFVIDNAPECQS